MKTHCRRILITLDQLHLLRRIAHQKRTTDLPIYRGQMPMLEYIQRYPGCTQAEVSERFFISPASVAQSTKRMEKTGFLEKRVDEQNQRCKKLYVTKEGTSILAKYHTAFLGLDEQLISGFTPSELAQLEGYLNRLLTNFAGAAEVDMKQMDKFSFFALMKKIEDDQIRKEKERENV